MRGPSVAVRLAALVLLAAGGVLVGAPVRTAGPIDIDFAMPLGVVCLVAGVGALESLAAHARRWAYLLAALAVAVPAGWHLYAYPPIEDGAWFILRHGADADRWAPAPPVAHMVAFAVVAWAVERALGEPRAGGRGLGARLLIVALGVIASCAAYEVFMRLLNGEADTPRLVAACAGMVLLAAGCAAWRPGNEATRAGLSFGAMSAAVSLASWGLYRL